MLIGNTYTKSCKDDITDYAVLTGLYLFFPEANIGLSYIVALQLKCTENISK